MQLSHDRQEVGHGPAETIGAVDQQHVAGGQVVDARVTPGRAAFFPVILSVKILSARLRSAPLSESAGFDPASTRVANRPHVYLPNPVSLVRFVWP